MIKTDTGTYVDALAGSTLKREPESVRYNFLMGDGEFLFWDVPRLVPGIVLGREYRLTYDYERDEDGNRRAFGVRVSPVGEGTFNDIEEVHAFVEEIAEREVSGYEWYTLTDRYFTHLGTKIVQRVELETLRDALRHGPEPVHHFYRGFSMDTILGLGMADIRCPHGVAIDLINNTDYSLPSGTPQQTPSYEELVLRVDSYTDRDLENYCFGHSSSTAQVSVSGGVSLMVPEDLLTVSAVEVSTRRNEEGPLVHTLVLHGKYCRIALGVGEVDRVRFLGVIDGAFPENTLESGALGVEVDTGGLSVDIRSRNVFTTMDRGFLHLETYEGSTRYEVRLSLTDTLRDVIVRSLEGLGQ